MHNWITRCLIVFYYLLWSECAVASWEKMSDEELAILPVIVYGQYLGTSLVKTGKDSTQINLGVIKVLRALKGRNDDGIYFIKAYSPNAPISSDMLFFKGGQIGIWFLQPVIDSEGLFQITHPSQFQRISENSAKFEHWKTLLK